MPEILYYSFFQNAILGALLVSICCGILGTYIVARRLVFICGGITHASFGGLGLGFFAGWNPIVTAMLFSILSALGVEKLAKNHAVREDSAIAVFWALGMALGIIFIFMTPGFTPNLTEYLFGNILTITRGDLLWFSVFCCVLVLFISFFLRSIIFVAFDPEFAKVRNFPVRFIEYTMMCFIAMAIVLTIRMVGIVLLMSVITLPQMIAGLYVNNFRQIMIWSVIVCFTGCVAGLFTSYALNVPTGATVVCILVFFYLLCKAGNHFTKIVRSKRQ